MITKYRVVTARKERCYPEMIKTMLKQKQNLDVFLPKQGFFSPSLSLSFVLYQLFIRLPDSELDGYIREESRRLNLFNLGSFFY